MPIPARTNRAHLLARDPRCDTVKVLNMAGRRLPGRRFADMNACAGLEHDWNLHFPGSMAANHFTHIKDARTGKIRRCTAREAHTPILQIPTSQMLRYRKRVGRKWVRPFTVAQRNRQAKRRLVRVCWELKSRAYATRPELAVRFVRAINATGWSSYYMTLVTMWGWGPKLRNFKQAGAETALQPHGARRARFAADLETYAPFIDRHWGAWR